jgi:hypothetical protein
MLGQLVQVLGATSLAVITAPPAAFPLAARAQSLEWV